MTAIALDQYTDKEIVDGLIANRRDMIEYFFYRKCSGLLYFIVCRVYKGAVDTNEVLNELFLYLAANNWHKLRQFDFRSKLTTWLGVVAIRFFQKNRSLLTDNDRDLPLIDKGGDPAYQPTESWSRTHDIRRVISRMKNERYRYVVELMDIDGRTPEETAAIMGISVANLYNLRHRAHAQLAMIIGRKEEWYD